MLEAVSEATLAGLKVGVGLTIIADQLPKLLGIPATEGDFFGDVWNAIKQLPEANVATALIGGITIVFLLVLRAWKPKIPGPLLALAVGIGLVVFTGVTDRGVATIPEVPTGLPAAGDPSLPASGGIAPVRPGNRAHGLLRDRDRGPDRPAARRPAHRQRPGVHRRTG